MRVAFDSRAKGDPRGIGRYVRCLLDALRETARARQRDHRDPPPAPQRRVPLARGSTARTLRCPCPMVVTLHDLVNLKRRGEYLRTGMRFRLRYLAVQRADRVIVPTAGRRGRRARAPRHRQRADQRDRRGGRRRRCTRARPRRSPRSARASGCPSSTCCGSAGMLHPEPRKRVAELARGAPAMPLVLVGPARPWAHELPDVTLTGQVTDDELAAIYTRRARARLPLRRRGLRAADRSRRSPAARRSSPATRRRCARCSASARRSCECGDMEGLLAAGASACARRRRRRPGPGPTPPRRPGRVYAAAARAVAVDQYAPRPQITAGSVLTRIVRSRKTDQRSR